MIFVLAGYIALLIFSVKAFAGKQAHRWIHSGYITVFLLPFLVMAVFLRIIGPFVGSGIGASAVGMAFALVTLITGLGFLYIGYTSKSTH
ncbi:MULTISPECIES: hypothetical protein [unclassified Planococcus (in: firmicutes)]|uniref:hypothetical protein n=1 Tax=unclassified Planococcus (in: firmicutes) TaxID=2662419 RepID=UPI000C7B1708|nr:MULTISPECIES: hypothetical protein [unclassified Planococcus (in: firmicutes)]PKG46271.1 hypothetical protein CXF66_07765 [Planococcus sp. Urea-trap-24]PKG90057.1 hypothetical protein CXF91_04110 [Planococcus sp. Urea-3u-39]PKH35769.1 hypothetical protein CXF77_16540 [Planococcus sp. MB-3u-09]